MTRKQGVAGRTALVTGANRGLGAALAEELLARGAARVWLAARNPDSLADALARHGELVRAIRLDVTDDADVANAARTLPDLDLLVSNAGVTYITPLPDTTLHDAWQTMDINFFGPYRLMQAFAPMLNARRGGIIQILSLAALAPAQDAELYSASKAAGVMLVHAARRNWPDLALSMSLPGLMDTDMMEESPLPKTPAATIAAHTIDGWEQGLLSIFPDLHAEHLRRQYVAAGSLLLEDPYVIMQQAIQGYLAALQSPQDPTTGAA